MAVTLNSTTASDTLSSTTTATTLTVSNMTVGSGSNRCLIAILCLSAAAVTGITATWNGVSMFQIVSFGSIPGNVVIFGLRNPASGNQSLIFNWTGVSEADAYALDFTGVEQSTDGAAFPHTGTGTANSSTAAATVTSAVGNATVAGFTVPSGFQTPTQTELWLNNLGAAAAYEGQRAAGAASVTFQNTVQSGPQTWVAAAVDIAAIAVADVLQSQIWM